MTPDLMPVRQFGIERPFTTHQIATVGTFTVAGIASNVLIPMSTACPQLMVPWLVGSDLIGLVLATAAGTTQTVDPAVPALREKLNKAVDKVHVNGKMGEIYKGHCYTCDMDVPKRTKHCKLCRKCVSEFDHHCEFLNTCIGKENHGAFLVTLSSGIAYMVSTVAMHVAATVLEYLQDVKDPMMMPIWLWASLNVALSACLLLPLAFLLAVLTKQIQAMMRGLTQYELYKQMSKAKRDEEAAENEEEEEEEMEECSEDEEGEAELEEVVVEAAKPVVIDYSWLLKRPSDE